MRSVDHARKLALKPHHRRLSASLGSERDGRVLGA